MKAFYKNIVVTPKLGATIQCAARDAQQLANREQMPVEFVFNGIMCIARPNGDHALLAERWAEKMAAPKIVESL